MLTSKITDKGSVVVVVVTGSIVVVVVTGSGVGVGDGHGGQVGQLHVVVVVVIPFGWQQGNSEV